MQKVLSAGGDHELEERSKEDTVRVSKCGNYFSIYLATEGGQEDY